MIDLKTPAMILAPMEGVTDSPMRALMTERCHFTHCVTEFLRISQEIPPKRIYLEHADELENGCKTPTGIPVIFQLLGGDPQKLAAAALQAIELGAQAIDLNFGCPAKTVNRNDGGATLLKYPDRIYQIVRAVRETVPSHLFVSVKMRLGWDSIDPIYVNAEMAAKAGANWITVHGRTRTQGYTPPAYWEPIAELKKNHSIPIIANGEIWTLDDFKRCRDLTQCNHFMLGRGALANPLLPMQVARELKITNAEIPSSMDWMEWLKRFDELSTGFTKHEFYLVKRMKQWLRYADHLDKQSPFQSIKTAQNKDEFLVKLQEHQHNFK